MKDVIYSIVRNKMHLAWELDNNFLILFSVRSFQSVSAMRKSLHHSSSNNLGKNTSPKNTNYYCFTPYNQISCTLRVILGSVSQWLDGLYSLVFTTSGFNFCAAQQITHSFKVSDCLSFFHFNNNCHVQDGAIIYFSCTISFSCRFYFLKATLLLAKLLGCSD